MLLLTLQLLQSSCFPQPLSSKSKKAWGLWAWGLGSRTQVSNSASVGAVERVAEGVSFGVKRARADGMRECTCHTGILDMSRVVQDPISS